MPSSDLYRHEHTYHTHRHTGTYILQSKSAYQISLIDIEIPLASDRLKILIADTNRPCHPDTHTSLMRVDPIPAYRCSVSPALPVISTDIFLHFVYVLFLFSISTSSAKVKTVTVQPLAELLPSALLSNSVPLPERPDRLHPLLRHRLHPLTGIHMALHDDIPHRFIHIAECKYQ